MEYLACYFLSMDWFAIKAFRTSEPIFFFIKYVKATPRFIVTSESINITKPALDVTVTFCSHELNKDDL